MDEMIRYIFTNLQNSETSIKNIDKALCKQKSFNRFTILVTMAMGTNLIIQSIKNSNMNSYIRKLEVEIEKLKRTEGE